MITLKDFQETKKAAIVRILRETFTRLGETADPGQQRQITLARGLILLKAPTGSGKTLTIARALEEIRDDATVPGRGVVWFWFTPFSGLVGQTMTALRGHCPGLRVRDPSADRDHAVTAAGDVFITTWASVAVRRQESRRMRRDDDFAPALDTMIDALRTEGWRIGAVVDESHHGFMTATQARRFYQTVLRPDVTILTSATPGKNDVEEFQRTCGYGDVHWLEVSRDSAVAERLNKEGVRAVTFEPDHGDRPLLDMEEVCIESAVARHEHIKTALNENGVPVTPLTLIQVDNDTHERPTDLARERLLALGVDPDAIATHTAEEPDANFHALANDHTKEFLIFKLAAATGFDVPRAWCLASIRSSRSKEFGLQVLGRIMRVHPLLQPREDLPEALDYGYVFISRPQTQDGLVGAATDINTLRDTMREVTNDMQVIRVGSSKTMLIGQNGVVFDERELPQPESEPAGEAGAAAGETAPAEPARPGTDAARGAIIGQQTDLFGLSTDRRTRANPRPGAEPPPQGFVYPFKDELGAPRRFRTEHLPPEHDGLLDDIVNGFSFRPEMMEMYNRTRGRVTETDLEVFTQTFLGREEVWREYSDERIFEESQRSFSFSGSVDPGDLQCRLLAKLRGAIRRRGWEEPEEWRVRRTLELIVILFPQALPSVMRTALAARVEPSDAAELPEAIRSPVPLRPSPRNVYGVMPPIKRHVPVDARHRLPCFDTQWEHDFARILDSDNSSVLWWHRNEDRKPTAVSIVRPDGRRYFPDLVVGVTNRASLDNIALVEVKQRWEDSESRLKVRTDHTDYGKVLMVAKEEQTGTFFRVLYDDATQRNRLEAQFEVDMLRLTA